MTNFPPAHLSWFLSCVVVEALYQTKETTVTSYDGALLFRSASYSLYTLMGLISRGVLPLVVNDGLGLLTEVFLILLILATFSLIEARFSLLS